MVRLDVFMLRVVEAGGPFRYFYVKSGGGWGRNVEVEVGGGD